MATALIIGTATGQHILSMASLHLGEAYLLGTLVPKDNPNWHGSWDCAEFASWLHYQAAGQLYGCNQDTGILFHFVPIRLTKMPLWLYFRSVSSSEKSVKL